MSSFADLGLSQNLLSVLGPMGLTTPTEIQARAIPILLGSACDFIGLAQTGTGKTAAFALPLLDRLDPNSRQIQAVVLSPTRELGQQIAKQITDFAGNTPLRVEVVYGGASIQPQIRALRQAVHVVVATPGRLIDLLERKALRLDAVSTLILDEADEMLNMGFREEIDRILEYTADHASTWLFSATMPKGIRHIVQTYMENPVEVSIESSQRVNENIEHLCAIVKQPQRSFALKRFIDREPAFYGVVFCKTKIGTEKLADELVREGYPAEALNGDLSQSQRNQVMHRFKTGRTTLLIATDVAARGIDVHNLTHVVHYDLPEDIENYTHRSGRTARAGKKGISLCLITKGQMPRIKQLEKTLKIKVAQTEVPTMAEVLGQRVTTWAEGLRDLAPEAEIPEDLLKLTDNVLEGVDRDELLHRLLSQELRKMGWSPKSSKDAIRAEEGPRSRQQDLEKASIPKAQNLLDAGGDAGREGPPFRYFINAGSMDQIQKGDLLRMICDMTGLTREMVGNIDLREKHSFFELLHQEGHQMERAFRGLKLRGRPIRVKLEMVDPSAGSAPRGARPYRTREPHQGRGKNARTHRKGGKKERRS